MAAPPVAAVTFALTPAQATQGEILDMRDVGDRKIYHKAVSKLSEETYDCQPEGLFQFLRTLEDRAIEYGWDDDISGILQIPLNLANPMELTNLLTNYGEITLEAIRAFEETYISTQCRAAQDANMLYMCIMNSLSKEGKTKIQVWRDQYTVNGFKSGNLLLKIVIRESHLDTNATTSMIRLKLSNLDDYMPTIGSDITKFNTHVKLLMDSLAARGEESHDTLVNLFKGYMATSDKTFTDYITRLQESYDDGLELTAEVLMQRAVDKYKNLKQTNKWNAPTEEEEKIIALEAKLKQLQKKGGGKGAKDDKGKNGTNKNKKSFLPPWHKEKPKPEEMKKPREYNNKKWYWCCPETGGKCTGIWRTHKPEECRGTMKREKGEKRKPTQDANKDKRALKLAKALQATADGASSEKE